MELTKRENNQLLMQNTELDAILGDFNIDSSDILIPKVLLMQPVSAFVTEGEATIGDFRNSVTKEKLGSIHESFAFVPFHFTKTWDIVGDDGKWIRKEDFNPGDENKPWEFEENGERVKRIKRLDFFGFPLKKVADGVQLPMILSFRSSGYREGTKILTQFKLNIAKKKLPWSDIWGIKGEKLKNEDGQTYCVPKVDLIGESDEEVLKLCLEWYKNIKNMKVKITVDDSDVKREYTNDAMKDVSDTGNY